MRIRVVHVLSLACAIAGGTASAAKPSTPSRADGAYRRLPVQVNLKPNADVVASVRVAQGSGRTTFIKTTFGQLRVKPGQPLRFDIAGGHVASDPSSGVAFAERLTPSLGPLEMRQGTRVLGTMDSGSASKFAVRQALDTRTWP